ncbi:MAG: hypothetical protein Q9163_001048 [Psora crenata]
MYYPNTFAILASIVLGLTLSNQVMAAPTNNDNNNNNNNNNDDANTALLVPRQIPIGRTEFKAKYDPPAPPGPGSNVFSCVNPNAEHRDFIEAPYKYVWQVAIDRPFEGGHGCSALENAVRTSHGDCKDLKPFKCETLDGGRRTILQYQAPIYCGAKQMEDALQPLIVPATLKGQFRKAEKERNTHCEL